MYQQTFVFKHENVFKWSDSLLRTIDMIKNRFKRLLHKIYISKNLFKLNYI